MYAVVKHLEEELAGKLVRWDPQLSITGLRFSNVLTEADYAQQPEWEADPSLRRWNLWGYIDTRDGALAVLRALENAGPGFDTFIIANADTVVARDERRPCGRILPGGRAEAAARRQRDSAVDRQGPAHPALRTPALLAFLITAPISRGIWWVYWMLAIMYSVEAKDRWISRASANEGLKQPRGWFSIPRRCV